VSSVFVVDACRTPIGKIKGALAQVRPDHLAADVIKAPLITLGETAENVAGRYGITRERQDQWALRSHRLAADARDAGRFDAEIVPLSTERAVVRHDEDINASLTAEELAAKKPAFRTGGTVTGGNSSLGCSGARIVATLLHEMRRRGAARGAATMCIGVGQGIASLWEPP
jgi:acetyl-CoA acetyltransferase